MSAARVLSLAGAFALAVSLTGCVQPTERWTPAPLSDEKQLEIYERSLDDRWRWVEQQFPEATRPEVSNPLEIDQDTWAETMGQCLSDVGYTVVVGDDGGYTAESAPDADAQALAVGDYYCNAVYPWVGTFDSLLSEEQLDALYTYYVEIVTPCLQLSGREVEDIPRRDYFVSSSYSWVSWHPLWSTTDVGYTDEELRAANALCPLEPWWHTGIMTGY